MGGLLEKLVGDEAKKISREIDGKIAETLVRLKRIEEKIDKLVENYGKR